MTKNINLPLNAKPDFPLMDSSIIAYWKKNKTFEKSLKLRSNKPHWTFLDGPPFITGMPHYGTLLSSIPKDVFGRYWTMKGYYVRRVWGWDGHGLPIENKVEEKLKIKRKIDIEEKIGIKTFINECKLYVNEVSGEWEWYVDRIGRWVDFKNAYRTWDTDYMESVMWVFKNIYDKGYIYKGLRVSLFCPHCVTPISNFEVAMDADNYKLIREPGTYYKFKVKNQKNTYLLAWSTTPWNKMVTTALAVNPHYTYVTVRTNDADYILAKSTLSILKNTPYKIISTYKGNELLGIEYEPLYTFFEIDKTKKAFIVCGGDFVSAEEGTGIVTIAPYGVDDMELMKRENIHIELHVDEEGIMKNYVPLVSGKYYLAANEMIDKDLEKRGFVFSIEEHEHKVPTCWRCHTRLYYAPQHAWYVDIQSLKPLLKKTNKNIHWVPDHFKYGRFLKSMEAAPDWCISRSRYWGSPVPVWECDCGNRFVPGSIHELEKAAGKKISDLHKPEIDKITVICSSCGKKVHRVPEVLDSWIEAGSASFAERHFPFNSQESLDQFFPPDFISEYTGQIRAWFYVVHVIAAALFQSSGFKNVLVSGVILGDDGRKMSKNYKNYPDPKMMLEKYGGDALRLYLLGSPVMQGNDIIISEEEYRNQVKDTLLILWNTYKYYLLYADKNEREKNDQKLSDNILDRWILIRLQQAGFLTTTYLDSYDTSHAVMVIHTFIQDISTWYIRRSRDRFVEGDKSAMNTLNTILVTLCRIAAPVIPFITEEIYIQLTKESSVHLSDYPQFNALSKNDDTIITAMNSIREIASLGNAQRKSNQISIRQPLSSMTIKGSLTLLHDQTNDDMKQYTQILKDELNIKNIIWINAKQNQNMLEVSIDTTITPELKAEGDARDIIRKIQVLRKKQGLSINEYIHVTIQSWPLEYDSMIKEKTLAATIKQGASLEIQKIVRAT